LTAAMARWRGRGRTLGMNWTIRRENRREERKMGESGKIWVEFSLCGWQLRPTVQILRGAGCRRSQSALGT
jgi:hypothetical protein